MKIKSEIQIFHYEGNDIAFDFGDGQKMINATQMGKVFGKEPIHFLRNAQSERFISALSQSANLQSENVVKVINGGRYFGTWMHEKLALKFAAWLAPEFELWIYDRIHELLTTGETSLNKGSDDDVIFKAMQILNTRIEESKRQLVAANETIDRQAPAVEYYDEVLQSDKTYTVTTIAKELDLGGAKTLNKMLHEKGVQYHHNGHWVLYHKYKGKDLTRTKTHRYYDSEGKPQTSLSTVWTEKGRLFIHQLFNASIGNMLKSKSKSL